MHKKENVTLVFKEGNITSISGKVIVQTLLEAISNPIKDKKVTGISQHSYEGEITPGQPLCDELTAFVAQEGVVHVTGL